MSMIIQSTKLNPFYSLILCGHPSLAVLKYQIIYVTDNKTKALFLFFGKKCFNQKHQIFSFIGFTLKYNANLNTAFLVK